jgi:hypothetical protein
MSRCPSDLALEAFLLDPKRSSLTPHVDACNDCRIRVARMESEGEDFRRFVFPATVEAVEEAMTPRHRRLFSWLMPVGGLVAAAAALMLVVRIQQPSRPTLSPDEPPPGYIGLRGPKMSLAVFVGGERGATAVTDGAVVPANAQLRFKVRPAPDCKLWIVSVDVSGQVFRLYPATGEASVVSEAGALPGGAVLDGTGGPERIYAVCAPEPLPFGTVERSAKAAAGGGAEKVRKAGELQGLPASASQATLLLEKKP